jgi:hypothetical protein
MLDDDWIKFGHSIWVKNRNKRKAILKKYKIAWTNIYQSKPLLQNDGPMDLLDNPKYTCNGKVPWSQHVEARFALPMVHHAPTTSNAAASGPLPSASSSKTPSPATPSVDPLSYPNDIMLEDVNLEKMDRELDDALKAATCEIVLNTAYPRVKDGLLPGFVNYLSPNNARRCLSVVFVIVPQYIITEFNDKPTCDISAVEVDQIDVDSFTKVEPNCMYRAKDQSNCTPGKVRYFCNSWVGPYFVSVWISTDRT